CQPRKLWQGGRSPPASPAAAALLYQRNASVALRGRPPLAALVHFPSLSPPAVLPASAALCSPRTISMGRGTGGGASRNPGTLPRLKPDCWWDGRCQRLPQRGVAAAGTGTAGWLDPPASTFCGCGTVRLFRTYERR